MLKRNTSSYKDIQLLKNGIWDKSCTLYLIDLGEGHASFRVTEKRPDNNVIAEIEAISIDDLMQKFNLQQVDLLKMDIEGSEYNCFEKEEATWIDKASCIAIEIHEHMYPGCKALIDRSLGQRKYELNGEYHIYTKTKAG
jgi:FkbM family methyltransferase